MRDSFEERRARKRGCYTAFLCGLVEEEVCAVSVEAAGLHFEIRGDRGRGNREIPLVVAVPPGSHRPSSAFKCVQPHHAQDVLQNSAAFPCCRELDYELSARTSEESVSGPRTA
eukprot:2837773-Rhodomonas_salina.4